MVKEKEETSGTHHCSLKRFLKSEHKGFYKLLKNTFCADFIFSDAREKTILIPNDKLLEEIKNKYESKPQEAFDDIKALILNKPHDNLADVPKSKLVNLKEETLTKTFDRGDIKKITYTRWVDKQDKNHDKKMADLTKTVIYQYLPNSVPASSLVTGKGISGGSVEEEEVDIYLVLTQWLTKFSKEKDPQLKVETCAVSVINYLKIHNEELFKSVSKYVICPNALITLYSTLILLNSSELKQIKPVVEAFTLEDSSSYPNMIKSLANKKSGDHDSIVKKLLSKSNKYDMYEGLIKQYNELVKDEFSSVRSVPKSKHGMYKLMVDELIFNDNSVNKYKITHQLIDDMLCTIKFSKLMCDHSSLYNPLLLNGVNYTFGSSESNDLIKNESVKYLTEFINSKQFLYVNDAKSIVTGGNHEDKTCKLSVLKDLLKMIQDKIDHYDEDCEKKGEGSKPRKNSMSVDSDSD